MKKSIDPSTPTLVKYEYYNLDASGNLLSTYQRTDNLLSMQMLITAGNQPIYGSQRLGINLNDIRNKNTYQSTFLITDYISSLPTYVSNFPGYASNSTNPNIYPYRPIALRIANHKRYELTDHLGNIRVSYGHDEELIQ